MKLSEFCVKRPVFTTVLNLLLIVVGIVGYSRLELRDLPKMETSVVSIYTSYNGASAEIIENQITRKLEDVLSSLEGLDTLTSTTKDSSSQITITFKPGYDVESGMNHIRDKISMVSREFSDDVSEPVLQKADLNANPTIFVSFSDEVRSNMTLTDYVDTYVKPAVEQVEGVGTVQLWGARNFSVRLWPDPVRMAARAVTIQDIEATLKKQNVNIAGGEIESETRNYTVVPATRIQNLEGFNRLILKDEAGKVVYLQDVAGVQIGPAYDQVFVHSDGKPSLVMAVTPQSTANPVTVSADIMKFLDGLKPSLPRGMSAHVVYDKAVFIKASIENVYVTLLEAVALVVLVVFGFLGNLRGTTVPIVTIPICLLGIFGFLYFAGYSINNMTLLALVLAIGLVVDDAIVMLENVHRHIERGMKPMQAALTASREIGFAIIVMTLTLVAVYAPIGFIEGTTGNIFKEFAYTLAGTVLISGCIVLTLSPMMCAHVLPDLAHEGRYAQWLDATMARLKMAYQNVLRWSLRWKKQVLKGIALIAVAGAYGFTKLPAELAPTEDAGYFMTIMIAPSASNSHYIEEQLAKIEKIFDSLPEKKSYVAVGGVPTSNQGIAFLELKPWYERSRSQSEIIGSVMPAFMAIPGVLAFPIAPPPLPVSGDDPVEFVVQLTGSYEELNTLMTALKSEVTEHNPQLTNVRVDLDLDTPQLRLQILRDVAADLKVDVAEVMDTISTLMGGRKVTEPESGARSYDVKVQLRKELRKNQEQLQDIYVRNRLGEMVPLTSPIKIDEKVGAQSLSHYNRLRSATLTASLAPGYTQGEAVAYMQDLADRVLGDKAKYSWGGQTREYLESSGSMTMTTILALLFIYLVLAAQFESFRDPFIIMLTVPFSMTGAVLLLNLTGGTNNMYTQIGFVTLIGLVTKHGILITEFANRLLVQGKTIQEAVVEAAGTRLRPILMTTGAMVLGAIPLALASGAGAYARMQLGWTIVGGMTLGTLFSLVVVPLAYTIIRNKQGEDVNYE